jgi:hypothetical protein
VFEHRAAGDEDLSTCPHHVRHRVPVDSTVDFDAKVQPARLPERESVSIFLSEEGMNV